MSYDNSRVAPEHPLAEEKPKPNAERLREYRDSNLESLEFELFSRWIRYSK